MQVLERNLIKTEASADKCKLKQSKESEITIEAQTQSISCRPFVGFVTQSDHQLVCPPVFPTCTTYLVFNKEGSNYLRKQVALLAYNAQWAPTDRHCVRDDRSDNTLPPMP